MLKILYRLRLYRFLLYIIYRAAMQNAGGNFWTEADAPSFHKRGWSRHNVLLKLLADLLACMLVTCAFINSALVASPSNKHEIALNEVPFHRKHCPWSRYFTERENEELHSDWNLFRIKQNHQSLHCGRIDYPFKASDGCFVISVWLYWFRV